MSFQVCPFHADEAVAGLPAAEGALVFTCGRTRGHPESGPWTWLSQPEVGTDDGSGLVAELGLRVELPTILRPFAGCWAEYGVVEHAYAVAQPKDFAFLVERYGHTAIGQRRYTASAFLAGALGGLARTGVVLLDYGDRATGRWSYNGPTSWWSLPPAPLTGARVSWADTGLNMDYVPGSTEP